MVNVHRAGASRRPIAVASRSSQLKNVILIFILLFLVNFWIMSTFFPSSTSQNAPGLRVPDLKVKSTQDDNTEAKCPDYGCPIYPAELTPYLKELLDKMFIQKTQDYDFDFGTDSMALLTQTGKSHFYNQDRSVYVSPYRTAVTPNDGSPSFLIGIFDGHGVQGHIVADRVTVDLPQRLADKLNGIPKDMDDNSTDQAIVQILKETFVEVDTHGSPNFLLGGCTASVTFRRGSKLYFANAGDSQTIVVGVDQQNNQKDPEVLYMTRKDKAKLPDEYERIVGLGGNVHINEKSGDSRVVVYSRTSRDTIGLAMSRSIGDWEWKPIGVTAEPLVDIVDLTQFSEGAFLIAASDGIWDMRRREFYAKQFVESFYRGQTPPLQKVWDVIQKVTPTRTEGYRDDMTLVVTKL